MASWHIFLLLFFNLVPYIVDVLFFKTFFKMEFLNMIVAI